MQTYPKGCNKIPLLGIPEVKTTALSIFKIWIPLSLRSFSTLSSLWSLSAGFGAVRAVSTLSKWVLNFSKFHSWYTAWGQVLRSADSPPNTWSQLQVAFWLHIYFIKMSCLFLWLCKIKQALEFLIRSVANQSDANTSHAASGSTLFLKGMWQSPFL